MEPTEKILYLLQNATQFVATLHTQGGREIVKSSNQLELIKQEIDIVYDLLEVKLNKKLQDVIRARSTAARGQ
ncbi:TPA: hypothetical protein ACNIQM_002128 [Citrobacter werkmanii]